MQDFLLSSGRHLCHEKDAWLIYDTEAPPVLKCKTIIVAAPYEVNYQTSATKRLRKQKLIHVYVPPWSLEELIEIATTVHQVPESLLPGVVGMYNKFGGIPRFPIKGQAEPLSQIYQAQLNPHVLVQTFCSREIGPLGGNHSANSDPLIHIVPEDVYLSFKPEWSSSLVMKEAFERIYNVKSDKIACRFGFPVTVHVRNFYSLFFEPWVHALFSRQGYRGKIRRLAPPEGSKAMVSAKGFLGGSRYYFPSRELHRFNYLSEIDSKKYNIPHNSATFVVDALCPSRGEMWQVTLEGNHSVNSRDLSFLKDVFEPWLATHKKVNLIFVVPPNQYDDFRSILINSKGAEREVDNSWIEQHVLRMDFPVDLYALHFRYRSDEMPWYKKRIHKYLDHTSHH
jgi:hypothetical protein